MSRHLFLISILFLITSLLYWSLFGDRNFEPYPRVDYWIQAAQCAQLTGKYLVVCNGTQVIPIDDVSLADDRGHTVILSLIAKVFAIDPTRGLLRAVNLAINAFSILMLSFLLNLRKMRFAAVVLNIFGMGWIAMRAGADVDAAYLGIGMMGVAAVILMSTPTSSAFKALCTMVGGLILVAIAVNLRQPIALGVVAATLITSSVSLLFWNTSSPFRRIVYFGAIALTLLAAIKTPGLITYIRDSWLNVKSSGISSHGIYHNLFLGLGGYVENKFGIVWDDRFAMEAMKKLYPTVAYCSDEYFAKIGDLYWHYVHSDPIEVIRIYLTKTFLAITESGALTLPCFVSILAGIALLYYAKKKQIVYSKDEMQSALATALVGLSFIAQGILTHPSWTYIHPGPALLTLSVLILSASPLKMILSKVAHGRFVNFH